MYKRGGGFELGTRDSGRGTRDSWTNPASGQGGAWTQGFRITSPALQPLRHGASTLLNTASYVAGALGFFVFVFVFCVFRLIFCWALDWGEHAKGRGASSVFLPSWVRARILEISSFALRKQAIRNKGANF